MGSQEIMIESRLMRLREMKAEVDRLKAENAALKAENTDLQANLDLAIAAAADLKALPEGGRFVVFDGWNLAKWSDENAEKRLGVIEKAKRHLAEHPLDMVWVVFDGPSGSVECDGRLRVSYTGGRGEQRADKFICKFLRMARYRGDIGKIDVWTHDKPLLSQVRRIVTA